MQTPPLPPLPPTPPGVLIEDVVLPILGMVLGGFIIWQLFRTINRWLDRRAGGAPDDVRALRADVERLRAQTDGVEELRHRVGELEERVDFTERVLSRQRERHPLGPGGG